MPLVIRRNDGQDVEITPPGGEILHAAIQEIGREPNRYYEATLALDGPGLRRWFLDGAHRVGLGTFVVRDGDKVRFTHLPSGRSFEVRVYDFKIGVNGKPEVSLAFIDPDRHFIFERPERLLKQHAPPPPRAKAAG